ncbi:MAG: PQQ-binding-like beta-propeller repeat protein [Planctomycetaceae bacterium]|nr:PQQ-binding-like beta-propeller repeat protein [Planctomycetaceae bacterium]
MHRVVIAMTMSLVVGSLGSSSSAADWPAFRGPHNNGFSDETGLPTEWSAAKGEEKNILWKAPLPAPGNSSPIVSGESVLVTAAEDDGHKRGVYCFGRADGKLHWKQVVDFSQELPTHKTNPFSAGTPATDGKVVVVWHGSAGLYCYDLKGGKPIWNVNLGEFRHMWGEGSSPIIHKGRIYLNCGPGAKTFMACLDLKNGQRLWTVDEPADGDGQKRTDGAPMGSWSTPQIVTLDGEEQVVVAQPSRVIAYRPSNGETIWFFRTKNEKGDLAYSSPVFGDGVCVMLGGYSGGASAFKPGGKGDITEAARMWYKPRNPQSIGTGVIIDGYLYVPDAGPGTIRCLEAKSGKEVWTDRASGGNHWGSIVVAEGRAYVTNQEGATVVFRPNPEKFEFVARNDLGEQSNSTPALSDGRIFLRTFEHLYCIGGK